MAEFLTGTDAALILRVSPATVRAMAERRDLPVAARTESGIRLYHRNEVIKLARKRADERGE